MLDTILPPENTYRQNFLLGGTFLNCDFWTCVVCWAHVSRLPGLATLCAGILVPHGDSIYDKGFAAASSLLSLPLCPPQPCTHSLTARTGKQNGRGCFVTSKVGFSPKKNKKTPHKCKWNHFCNLPCLCHCRTGQRSRSQYLWQSGKKISQLALPNYSLINWVYWATGKN